MDLLHESGAGATLIKRLVARRAAGLDTLAQHPRTRAVAVLLTDSRLCNVHVLAPVVTVSVVAAVLSAAHGLNVFVFHPVRARFVSKGRTPSHPCPPHSSSWPSSSSSCPKASWRTATLRPSASSATS